MGIFPEGLHLLYEADNLFGDGHGAGETGRLDAHQVDGAGGLLPPLDDEVVVAAHALGRQLGADAGKVTDEILPLEVGEDPAARPQSIDP